MGLGLSLKLGQGLALTPQLQQSIRLLQLSTVELNQEIQTMLVENPFLAVEDDEDEGIDSAFTESFDVTPSFPDLMGAQAADSAFDSEAEFDVAHDEPTSWEGDGSVELSVVDAEWGDVGSMSGQQSDGDGRDRDDYVDRSETTLSEHLLAQLALHRFSLVDRYALEHVVGCLDERGYLPESLDELASSLGGGGGMLASSSELDTKGRTLFDVLSWALTLIQSLEPAGVGATSVVNCLQLQIRRRVLEGVVSASLADDAVRILDCPMEWIARKDFKRIGAASRMSVEQVSAAHALVTSLHPRPAARFAGVLGMPVVPDVLVKKTRRGFRAEINPAVLPRLKIDAIYASAMKGVRGDGNQSWHQRLQEAKWFVKNVQQRFDTILRVSNVIVERQQSFFSLGAVAMRPLVLREIADELGLHESTISRVTTAKFLHSPFGTLELKYFFGSSLDTDGGGNTSSTAVKALIRQFVVAESRSEPLSDSALAEKLKLSGVSCARRTVAKYREALQIAPASLRKSQQ